MGDEKIKKVVFVYSEKFKELDFGAGHPMRGDRYEKAAAVFEKTGLLKRIDAVQPFPAGEDILGLFHTEGYIKNVKNVSANGHGSFGDEVPGFKGVFDVAALSAGASVAAADYVAGKGGVDTAINICGGWHHAFKNRGRGFCIFNDVAVTAEYLIKRKNIKRVMVLDYDAHHGDGTQIAFYDRSDVFTLSLHQDPSTLYPFMTGYKDETGEGKGIGFNKNIPLSSLCGDDEFISAFSAISEIIKGYKPEVLILQMGVDGSRECVVSNMQLTEKSYDYASKTIAVLQNELGFKIIALGGGGFVHPMLGKNWGIQIKNFKEG